jgi:hypothetical protein
LQDEGLCEDCPRYDECYSKRDLKTKAGKLAFQIGEMMLIAGECNGPVYRNSFQRMLGIDPRCDNTYFDDADSIMETVENFEWMRRQK